MEYAEVTMRLGESCGGGASYRGKRKAGRRVRCTESDSGACNGGGDGGKSAVKGRSDETAMEDR